MIEKYLHNKLLKTLIENSYLSETQVDVLLCRKFASLSGKRIKDAIKLREKNTTFGSFDRSYKQASVTVRKCIITLLVIHLLELTDVNFVDQLINLQKIMKQMYSSYTNDMSLIEEIIDSFIFGSL